MTLILDPAQTAVALDGSTTFAEGQELTDVCGVDDLSPDRGRAALVGDRQLAIFSLSTGDLYAIDNHDPCSGVNVLSRGIVGSKGDAVVVASPIYKQHFDLATGKCLEEPGVAVATFEARVVDGRVLVASG